MPVVGYTPGEWLLDLRGPLPSIQAGHLGYITVNCGRDNKANARLVAAAPKLYESLKSLARISAEMCRSCQAPKECMNCRIREYANKAIAEVGGSSSG